MPGDHILVNHHNPKINHSSSFDSNVTCYRLGSVGQDTLICLWDLTEDILKQSRAMAGNSCNSTKASPSSMVSIISCPAQAASTATSSANHTSSPVSLSKDSGLVIGDCATSSNSSSANNTMTNSLTQRLASLNFGDRKDKRNSSGRSGSASTSGFIIVHMCGACCRRCFTPDYGR